MTKTIIKYFTVAIINPSYNPLWMQEDKLVFRVLGIYNFEIRDNVSETVPLWMILHVSSRLNIKVKYTLNALRVNLIEWKIIGAQQQWMMMENSLMGNLEFVKVVNLVPVQVSTTWYLGHLNRILLYLGSNWILFTAGKHSERNRNKNKNRIKYLWTKFSRNCEIQVRWEICGFCLLSFCQNERI